MSNQQSETPPLRFQVYNPFRNFERVEEIWKTMLAKSRHSYFTSWGWISTWIKSLPAASEVELFVGYRGDAPVLAFFMGSREYRKYGLLPSRILSLHATGNPYYDCLYIEYNSILNDATAGAFFRELCAYLNNLRWDEIVLPGLSSEFFRGSEAPGADYSGNFYVLFDAIENSYYVDLEKIRSAGMDLLKLLSANKRSQIRRSIRQYELQGPVQIEEAASADEALAMLEDLAAAHQREWNRRGEPGVFSNRYLRQFHQELVRARFDYGEIQLLKISANAKPIGYLYNFVYRENVLFYQSGFQYGAENVYRPGLVSHYYAILHNAAKGLKTYDFLAGESEYKKSFSTDSTQMYWMRWIKNPRRYFIEKNIIAVKNRVKSTPDLAKRIKRMRNWIRAARR